MANLTDFSFYDNYKIGEIVPFSNTQIAWAEANGFLKCNGQVVLQSSYPDLYKEVGQLHDAGEFAKAFYAIGTTSSGNSIYCMTSSPSVYVIGGGNTLETSTNLVSWNKQTGAYNFYGLYYNATSSLFVAVGSSGRVQTSTNGTTWNTRTSGTSSALYAVTYGGGLYVYAGNGGALSTSTDAITWTARTSGTSSAIYALAYGNGKYVYSGGKGALGYSTDAITWTAISTYATNDAIDLSKLAYGNGIFLTTGDGYTFTSTDAINWKNITSGNTSPTGSATAGAPEAYTSLAYSSKYGCFILTNNSNQVKITYDGEYFWTFPYKQSLLATHTQNPGNGTYYSPEKDCFIFYGVSGNSIYTANLISYNQSTQFILPNAQYSSASVISPNYYIKAL